MNCHFCNLPLKYDHDPMTKVISWIAHCPNCQTTIKNYYISYILDSSQQIEACFISSIDTNKTKFSIDLNLRANTISISSWDIGPLFDSIYFPSLPIPQFNSFSHLMEIAEHLARRFNKVKTFL
jgi:hypothetical protein